MYRFWQRQLAIEGTAKMFIVDRMQMKKPSTARVLVIVPFPMSEENRNLRQDQLNSVQLGPDIAFDFESVRVAPRNYVSQYDLVLADAGILEAGMDAQRRGYDAVCIDTMSDSGVAALRSILDIPVIGPGRCSMLTALMLGDRFSIITMWSNWNHLYTKTLRDLKLDQHCASVRAIDIRPDNQRLLDSKESEIFPLLADIAMQCIEQDGANVILLGSTTMHRSHAYLTEKLPVPVINPGPLTYKLAELVLGLGLTHSRNAYPSPLIPKDDVIHAMVDAADKFDH
jgi:allantoin racemase